MVPSDSRDWPTGRREDEVPVKWAGRRGFRRAVPLLSGAGRILDLGAFRFRASRRRTREEDLAEAFREVDNAIFEVTGGRLPKHTPSRVVAEDPPVGETRERIADTPGDQQFS
jgi:hypothetical protein